MTTICRQKYELKSANRTGNYNHAKNWVIFYVDATVNASKIIAPADIKTMAVKIVQARLAKKASVARIALLLKKTSTDYKAIEAGTVMLSVDDAVTLAGYYGVDSGYFFLLNQISRRVWRLI